MGVEVKASACTGIVRVASCRTCIMASVQFPPGVKHAVTAEGVVVVTGGERWR
jgi:hypothetical protein